MTDQELDAISARAEKATPGPLITTGDEGYDEDFTHVVGVIDERWTGSRGFSLLADCSHHEGSNHHFIAHARTDVPSLVAALRDANAKIIRLARAYD